MDVLTEVRSVLDGAYPRCKFKLSHTKPDSNSLTLDDTVIIRWDYSKGPTQTEVSAIIDAQLGPTVIRCSQMDNPVEPVPEKMEGTFRRLARMSRGKECPLCSTLLPLGLRFCSTCGTSQPTCSRCGKCLLPSEEYCGKCGWKVGSASISTLNGKHFERYEMVPIKLPRRQSARERAAWWLLGFVLGVWLMIKLVFSK